MKLTERAEKVTNEVQRVMSSPGALMIPAPVKGIIQQLANLIEDMTREIERGKGE